MPRHREDPPSNAELLQGTLDMLILKVAALRPIHGYATSWSMTPLAAGLFQSE